LKITILALAVACSVTQNVRSPETAATTEVHVDPRIELVSIAMRLAGAEECRTAVPSAYLTDVERAFASFAEHPAIVATRRLHEEHHIGFDAPIKLAIHLDDAFRIAIPTIDDERWKGVDIAAYAGQLRAFAEASGFAAFFAAHADYYRAVERVLRERIDAEHPVSWFDAHFGRRTGTRYVVVPGLLEGRTSYGPDVELPGGVAVTYQVLGLDDLDDHGMPRVDDDTIATLITLGADAEAAAATVVGTERAHDLRMEQGVGWRATVSDYGGCKERR
jgi:hypothetical protein